MHHAWLAADDHGYRCSGELLVLGRNLAVGPGELVLRRIVGHEGRIVGGYGILARLCDRGRLRKTTQRDRGEQERSTDHRMLEHGFPRVNRSGVFKQPGTSKTFEIFRSERPEVNACRNK